MYSFFTGATELTLITSPNTHQQESNDHHHSAVSDACLAVDPALLKSLIEVSMVISTVETADYATEKILTFAQPHRKAKFIVTDNTTITFFHCVCMWAMYNC